MDTVDTHPLHEALQAQGRCIAQQEEHLGSFSSVFRDLTARQKNLATYQDGRFQLQDAMLQALLERLPPSRKQGGP